MKTTETTETYVFPLNKRKRENLKTFANVLCRASGSQLKAAQAIGVSQALISRYCLGRFHKHKYLSIKTYNNIESFLRKVSSCTPRTHTRLADVLLSSDTKAIAKLEKARNLPELSSTLRSLFQQIEVDTVVDLGSSTQVCWNYLRELPLDEREMVLQKLLAWHNQEKELIKDDFFVFN